MYNWPRKDISPKSIQLDARNPRLVRPGSKDSQKAIIEALFEASKVRELARNIAENGYFPDEALILIPGETARKYIVVEGNRRIAACQALLKPDVLKGTRHYQYIKRLSGKFDKSAIKKVHCIVAPDRESTRKILANKHTRIGREKWSIYAQGNYFYQDLIDGYSINEISELHGVTEGHARSNIQMCVLAESVLVMPWDEERLLWLRENIDEMGLGPVARVLGYSYVKENIARFSFMDNGNIISDLQVDEAVQFLMGLVWAANFAPDEQRLTHRAANDEADLKEYLRTYKGYLPDRGRDGAKFDALDLIGGQVTPSTVKHEYEAAKPVAPADAESGAGPRPDNDRRTTPKPRKKSGVFLREISPVLRNEKIDALLEEALRTTSRSKYATVFLVRALFEVVLATRVKERDLWADYLATCCNGNESKSGLDSLLKYALGRAEVIPDLSDRRALEISLNTINSAFRKLANLAMHSDRYLLTDVDVTEVRAKVTPVLAHLIEIE